MGIYILQANRQFGPFWIEQVIQFYQEGRISRSDLVWYADLPNWISVAAFFGVQEVQHPTNCQSMYREESLEKLVAKKEQLKSTIRGLQRIVQSRDEQRLQNRLDELRASASESLWFRQSRADVSVLLKHQNYEIQRQIAEIERQIAQLEIEIEYRMV